MLNTEAKTAEKKANPLLVEQTYKSLIESRDSIIATCKSEAAVVGAQRNYAPETIERLANFILVEEHPEVNDIQRQIDYLERFMYTPVEEVEEVSNELQIN